MAEYRTVRMGFWNDPYIESLSPEHKLLYLYLFTCPHTNNLGILEVSANRVSFESGLPAAAVSSGLERFESDGKLLRDGLKMWLTRFIKHQTTTSEKLILGLRRLIPEIGSQTICSAVCERYPHLFDTITNATIPSDTVSIPSEELEVGIGSLKGKKKLEVKAPPSSPRRDPEPEDPDLPYLADYVSEREPMSPAERQNRVLEGGFSGFRDCATFERFWAFYPWQIGKRAAWLAWQNIEGQCRNVTPERIITAIQAQIDSGHHFDSLDGKPAIPSPAKWLEQGRWDDALKPPGGFDAQSLPMDLDSIIERERMKAKGRAS